MAALSPIPGRAGHIGADIHPTFTLGACTVTFPVTSSHLGSNPNKTSGITTDQTLIAGDTYGATLTVTTQPAVANVTSSNPNGSYKAGAVIFIQIMFNAAVNVTGTPLLALNSGGTAIYSSGSGTNTLNFTYTVAAGQNSTKFDYTSTGALTLNGGTITDPSGNPAILTLPSPGGIGSLFANKTIAIDTIAPTVLSYNVLFG